MKQTHLTVRLSEELAKGLARWAKARGVPKSQVARDAVARYVGMPDGMQPADRSLSGSEIALRWRTVPRLTMKEATALEADIDASRALLPPIPVPWE